MTWHKGINKEVYFIIEHTKTSITKSDIMKQTKFSSKQVENALYQLSYEKLIRRTVEGKYRIIKSTPKKWQ